MATCSAGEGVVERSCSTAKTSDSSDRQEEADPGHRLRLGRLSDISYKPQMSHLPPDFADLQNIEMAHQICFQYVTKNQRKH